MKSIRGPRRTSNQIDPVRQLVLIPDARRKMPGKNAPALLDRDHEALRDIAATGTLKQGIDRVLPYGLIDLGSDPFIGNDARVMFGKGNEDQDTGAVFLARHAANHELLRRGAVRFRPERAARDDVTAERGVREEQIEPHENDDLRQENLAHGKTGQSEKQP